MIPECLRGLWMAVPGIDGQICEIANPSNVVHLDPTGLMSWHDAVKVMKSLGFALYPAETTPGSCLAFLHPSRPDWLRLPVYQPTEVVSAAVICDRLRRWHAMPPSIPDDIR